MQMWYLLHFCFSLVTLVNPFFRPVPQVIPLKNNVDAPANKNMETQPRFFSTKRRCRKAKVRLAGPTFEEQEVFLKELYNENMEQDVPVTVDEGI